MDTLRRCQGQRRVQLLALPPADLDTQCQTQRLLRGTHLFEAGRRPATNHFVSTGEVVLQRLVEDGERVVLQPTRQGFVGEASLQAERYHCDALVAADADVTRIPRQALLDALRADVGLVLRWIVMLNQEQRRLRQQCEWLSLRIVEARLLRLVRTEGGAAGLPLGSGLKTLAREIGVSHEALYRCVAVLLKRGTLIREFGWLRLHTAGAPDAA